MSRPLPSVPRRRAGPRAPGAIVAAGALTLLLLPTTADAQGTRHRLDAVFPAGGRAGEAVEVRLVGAELEAADALWFDHPGLSADRIEGKGKADDEGDGDASSPGFRVRIAPETPIGRHDVRVVGPLGVSNPRAFVVGRRPEAAEREPNDGPAQAGPIAIGQVVNGRIDGPTDVDWFAFDGKLGRRVIAALDSSTLDGPLDAEIRLFDSDGRELAFGVGGIGRDPAIGATLPGDGVYRVEVRDAVYDGSPAHVYRLALHVGPVVDAVTPRAAVPGSTATFTLLGRNLGGEATESVLADGLPLERKEVTIAVPDDLAIDPDRPGVGFVASQGGGVRGFWYSYEDERGAADPVFIAEAMGPVVVEEGPGEEAAMRLDPPCDVSGDFAEVGDEDAYRFEATKGQVWMIEVFADRIGSPVDSTLLVQRVLEDGTLRDVAEADDQDDPGTANRFVTGTVDPILRFQAPEDGTYQVTVGDLFNAPRVAPEAVYRLVIRPERPDFLLFATPSDPALPEGLTVRAGGRAAASVLAHRLDGFGGPIRVEAEASPAGVSADPVIIAAGQAEAPIVFNASAAAPGKLGTIRLVGRPIGEDGRAADAPARVAVPGSITRSRPGGIAATPSRVTRGLVVAVRPEAPFRLSAEPAEVAVTQGEEVELLARVTRREGVDAEIQVTTDIRRRVAAAAAAAKIGKDADSASIKLSVAANAAPGVYTLILRGGGKVAIPDPGDPDKPREVTVSEPSNPIILTVRKK